MRARPQTTILTGLLILTLDACGEGIRPGEDGGLSGSAVSSDGGPDATTGPVTPTSSAGGMASSSGEVGSGTAGQDETGAVGTSTTGVSTGVSTTAASSTGSSESTEPGTGDEGTSLAFPDLPGEFVVCSKVDVLLVVDASATMEEELASLPATFAEMQETLALEVGEGIEDFHIAVINACPKPPNFHNYGAGDTDCQFPDNTNWLASDAPKLDAQFACVVQLPPQDEALEAKGGTNGGYNSLPDTCSDKQDEDEQPAWTAAKSLDPGIAANAGFARSDALLLVIAITDEDEALVGPDDATEIHDAIVAAKGDAGRVVFLGIGGDEGGCNSAYGDDEVKDSVVLRQVAGTFGERGLYRDLCKKNGPDPIAAAFEEALTTVVDAACTQFVP
jgi:hypothetical protein